MLISEKIKKLLVSEIEKLKKLNKSLKETQEQYKYDLTDVIFQNENSIEYYEEVINNGK